jgi:ABC-type multidrug transport system ATPase subunit
VSSSEPITNSSTANPSRTSPTTEAVVALQHLSRNFGSFVALRDLTAEFHAGRLYAILGDNGAGKTTLLRVVAGLLQPTRGAVSILGSSDLRNVKLHIGYMAHASLLYDEMSALENLYYFAALYGIRDDARCRQVINVVGLDPTLSRRIGHYSQGMRQRLSLARAVVHDPEIVLLDEPFSNVDVSSAHEMVRVLGRMRDTGKTVLIVTHQAALLDGIADHYIYMAAGQIVSRSPEFSTSAGPSNLAGMPVSAPGRSSPA